MANCSEAKSFQTLPVTREEERIGMECLSVRLIAIHSFITLCCGLAWHMYMVNASVLADYFDVNLRALLPTTDQRCSIPWICIRILRS